MLKRIEAADKEDDKLRYPYSHHGPAVFGSKLADYLISEMNLREDRPELFNTPEKEASGD
jgi:hypothetical protein